MKKLLFLLSLLLVSSMSFSQSAKEMLAELDGKWSLDENGNVTIVRVIEADKLDKGEIFNRVLGYFTYNYVDGESVIQVKDLERGLIVGKGYYPNVHIGVSLSNTFIDTYHIIRVDVKDGRARIVISLSEYRKRVVGAYSQGTPQSTQIQNEYPVNPKGYQKTIMTKAFYKSYISANNSLDAIEKAILSGNTSSEIENNDW